MYSFSRIISVLCLIIFTVFSSVIFAFQSSSGGYSIHSQVNSSSQVSTGGAYTLQSGSSPINSLSSGGSYTLIGGAYRSSYTDVDSDGVPDASELLGLNGGDSNGDSIPDILQSHVATIPSLSTGHVLGLEVTSLSCNHILSLDDRAESQLVNDTLYNYPIGLLDFELGCTLPGASATVRVFFDADYSSTSNTWVFRKWDGTQWLTVSPQPVIAPYTFVTGPLSGMTVTTVTYSQTDGGNNDSDNSLNSTIRDPIGPAVLAPIVTPLPSGGGGGGGGSGGYSSSSNLTFNSPSECIQNTLGNWYRLCEKSPSQATFSAFAHNISCEGFIEKRNTEPEYEYSKNTPRKEALAIAVKMKKIGGVNVLPIESNSYQKIYTDIDYDSPSDWIPSVVETALANKMISAERSTFEPDRLITRSEAYAMIMSSVCIKPSEQGTVNGTQVSWQQKIHTSARKNGLTTRSWTSFEPEKSILRQELFVLAARAADWAENTGGCDPKPEACISLTTAPAIDNPIAEDVVDITTQQPGTFRYLYDTEFHTVMSYIVKTGGIPDGVRASYMRTYSASKVTVNRLSIRDLEGNYYPENQRFLAGQIVYVYLRKAE